MAQMDIKWILHECDICLAVCVMVMLLTEAMVHLSRSSVVSQSSSMLMSSHLEGSASRFIHNDGPLLKWCC
jgi:hypothetical protein